MANFPLSHTEVRKIVDNPELLDGDVYQQLYDYYLPEMPYGTAKARDGDPDQWIFNALERRLAN